MMEIMRVCLFDPQNGVEGMIHIILPDAKEEDKDTNPAHYA